MNIQLIYTSPLKYFEYFYAKLKIVAANFPSHNDLPFSENIVFLKMKMITVLLCIRKQSKSRRI